MEHGECALSRPFGSRRLWCGLRRPVGQPRFARRQQLTEVEVQAAGKNWGERRGLNPRPSVPQTDALPAELRSPANARK